MMNCPNQCFADEVFQDLEDMDIHDLSECIVRLDHETEMLKRTSRETQQTIDRLDLDAEAKILQENLDSTITAVSELEKQLISTKERQKKIQIDSTLEIRRKKHMFTSQVNFLYRQSLTAIFIMNIQL